MDHKVDPIRRRVPQRARRLASWARSDESLSTAASLAFFALGTTLGWASLLTVLWPATAYGADLARAFDRLTPTGRRPMDGPRGRVLVIVLIALLPLVVLAVLVLVLFVPHAVGEDPIARVGGYAFAAVVAVVGLSGFLALLYNLFSPADLGRGSALRGGAWAALAITFISIGYVIYMRLGATSRNATAPAPSLRWSCSASGCI